MKGKRMAAQPGNRCRQTSNNDTAIIAFDMLFGTFSALACVSVPLAMALLKSWGVW